MFLDVSEITCEFRDTAVMWPSGESGRCSTESWCRLTDDPSEGIRDSGLMLFA